MKEVPMKELLYGKEESVTEYIVYSLMEDRDISEVIMSGKDNKIEYITFQEERRTTPPWEGPESENINVSDYIKDIQKRIKEKSNFKLVNGSLEFKRESDRENWELTITKPKVNQMNVGALLSRVNSVLESEGNYEIREGIHGDNFEIHHIQPQSRISTDIDTTDI